MIMRKLKNPLDSLFVITDEYMRSADDRKHCVYTLLPDGAVNLGQT